MYNHKNVYHCHLICICYHSYLFVCVCVCARASHDVHVEVRRQPKKVSSFLSFYHIAPGDQNQVIRLSSKSPSLLSHLTAQSLNFFTG